MAGNRSIQEITFHQNATSVVDGNVYQITSDASTINIDFDGSGDFTAVIEGKVSYNSSAFDEIMAVNLKTLEMSAKPNTLDTYQCDLTAWSYIRVRITSITGNISVYGKLVG